MKKPLFVDAGDFEEDQRIELIARTALAGGRIGFVVEDDEKADRYIKKLTERFKVSVVSRTPGPIEGCVTVVIISAASTN